MSVVPDPLGAADAARAARAVEQARRRLRREAELLREVNRLSAEVNQLRRQLRISWQVRHHLIQAMQNERQRRPGDL